MARGDDSVFSVTEWTLCNPVWFLGAVGVREYSIQPSSLRTDFSGSG